MGRTVPIETPKKFIDFELITEEDNHYLISSNKDDQVIGQICKGEIFKKRVVFISDDQTEWTSECLRQVADKLDALEGGG